MAYCEVTDIEAQYKTGQTFTTTTVVKRATVEDLIERKSSYIDSRLRFRYVVPVDEATNEPEFLLLKDICVLLVTSEVDQILREAQPIPADRDVKEVTRYKDYYNRAMKELERLESGVADLENITKKSSRFKNSNVANNVCPVFSKDKTQW